MSKHDVTVPADGAISPDERNADLMFAGVVIVGMLLCSLLYLRFPTIVLVWFLSATISYALVPLADRLSRRMPRSIAVALLAVGAIGLFIGGLVLFAPAVVTQLAHLPTAFGVVRKEFAPRMEAMSRWLPADALRLLHWVLDSARSSIASAEPNPETLSTWAGRAAEAVSAVTTSVLLVPLFVVMMLRGYHEFLAAVAELIPPRWRVRTLARVAEADDVLSGFVRGQLVVALVLIAMYGAAFSLIGIPLALLVAILAGIGELVPYLGGFIALSFGSLMAIAGGRPRDVVWVVAAYIAIQTVQGIFVSPWIVGQKVKLSPVTVIVALAIGAELLGFVGLLAAVPATALLKVAVRALVAAYRNTSLFSTVSSVVVIALSATLLSCAVDRNVLLTENAGTGGPNSAAALLDAQCPVAAAPGGFAVSADRFDLLAPPVKAQRLGVRLDRGTIRLVQGSAPVVVWAARVIGRSTLSAVDAAAVRDSVQLSHAVDVDLLAAAVLGDTSVRSATGDSDICLVALVPTGYDLAAEVGMGQLIFDGLSSSFQGQLYSGAAQINLTGAKLVGASSVTVSLGAVTVTAPAPPASYDAALALQVQAGSISLGQAPGGTATAFPTLQKQPLGAFGEVATGNLGAGGALLTVAVESGSIAVGHGSALQ